MAFFYWDQTEQARLSLSGIKTNQSDTTLFAPALRDKFSQ